MESIENLDKITASKKFLKRYTRDELKELFLEIGIKKYRAEQIADEIYIKRTQSFQEMTLLPQELRDLMDRHFVLNSLKIGKIRRSVDGSIKFLFNLHDGKSVEAVFMPWYDEDISDTKRISLCISSMAGCPVECAFCATGTLGMQRNLDAAEIVDQVMMVEQETGSKITNIVFMGMGEPLLNFKNVLQTIKVLIEDKNKLLARKRITVSSVGFPNRIKELADTGIRVNLAISLHATTNGFRHKLIPFLKNISISDLMDSLEYYYRKSKNPITYEYIMFDGMNDTDEDAKRLAKIAKRVPSKVNIIPYNDISFTNPTGFTTELSPTPHSRMLDFANMLRSERITVVVRDTFGSDIEAACGQLALSEG
jgi:23S rRNA (adenine2503-C2)-methyltransferase